MAQMNETLSTPHPMDVHVGQRLRMQRSFLGLSQKAVGEKIGVTFQQIQKYERGVNRISASLLHELSQLLRVPVAFFFEGVAAPNAQGFAEPAAPSYEAGPSVDPTSKESMQLLRAYFSLPNDQLRKQLYDLALSMGKLSGTGSSTKS